MKTFGKIIFLILTLILNIIFCGFVFQKLWIWLILPVFNLPVLTLIQAIGVMFFINATIKVTKKDFWEIYINKLLNSIITASVALGVGYLITLFM
jgi:hypothetical protein